MAGRLIEIVKVLVEQVHKDGYQLRAVEDDIYAEKEKRAAAEKDRDHWRQARQDAIEAGELMKAEIETLRQQLSADAVRQELESLKAKNAELLAKLATVENAAATENETLRQQLDAAVSATIDVRRRLAYEISQHNATNAEKIELFKQKEWANKHAAELVAERDAAQATILAQKRGNQYLRLLIEKVRGIVNRDDAMSERLEQISVAIDQFDQGTSEPTPATEPAPCPECERWQRTQRINSELFASKAKEVERLNAFVGKVRAVMDSEYNGVEFDDLSRALDELDAGNSEATLNSSAVKDSLTTEPEGGQ